RRQRLPIGRRRLLLISLFELPHGVVVFPAFKQQLPRVFLHLGIAPKFFINRQRFRNLFVLFEKLGQRQQGVVISLVARDGRAEMRLGVVQLAGERQRASPTQLRGG